LQNLENNTFREVFHIWYLWPVSGVQSDGTGLIAVLLEARALQRGGPGPIVVHCSPGTGRTGTLIALDLGIRQYEITRTVDVPRVVYTIRRDRAGAVQTKEQYAFIYKVIIDSIVRRERQNRMLIFLQTNLTTWINSLFDNLFYVKGIKYIHLQKNK